MDGYINWGGQKNERIQFRSFGDGEGLTGWQGEIKGASAKAPSTTTCPLIGTAGLLSFFNLFVIPFLMLPRMDFKLILQFITFLDFTRPCCLSPIFIQVTRKPVEFLSKGCLAILATLIVKSVI